MLSEFGGVSLSGLLIRLMKLLFLSQAFDACSGLGTLLFQVRVIVLLGDIKFRIKLLSAGADNKSLDAWN